MTKKRRGRRCVWCRQALPRAARGRPRLYCSATCRTRAWEARRRSERLPLALLRSDLDALYHKHRIRRIVIEVLVEAGLVKGPPPGGGGNRRLRVVR